MLIALDVDYRAHDAVTGCVGFAAWDAAEPSFELTREMPIAHHYQPGSFYLRELPCLLSVMEDLPFAPSVVVIDGYVWLGADKKGLGAHLYDTLGAGIAVVGVAKNRFHSASDAREVLRGTSVRPLYVTAAGMDPDAAAAGVRRMAGTHRIPDLLKRADRLCRDS